MERILSSLGARRRGQKWTRSGLIVPTNLHWYQVGTMVQLPPYAIRDTTGNGIGDLKGMARSLPFWAAQGHTDVWSNPICPSGGEDRGYDFTEYRDVDPMFGTLADFEKLVETAHNLGMKFIMDMVPSHTSRKHPYFEASRSRPSGPYGDWYVWNPTGEIYVSYTDADGRKREVQNVLEVHPTPRMVRDDDGDLWAARNWSFDRVRGEYYYRPHKDGQPALNWNNPRVRRWMLDNFIFWAEMGVDGFRVDAPTHILQKEGTKNWDLEEVHLHWQFFNRELTTRHPGVILLCEADVEDETSYAGTGEFHAVFDFRSRGALWLSRAKSDASLLLDTVSARPPMPPGTVRMTALSSHDDVRAKTYARVLQELLQSYYGNGERGVPFVDDAVVGGFAALLDFDRAAMELMLIRETALPGKPIRYYRDVIAVGHHRGLVAGVAPGSDPRDAVRTPMQWGPGVNARFSEAPPAELYLPLPDDPESTPERLNVEAALRNPRAWLYFERAVNWVVRNNAVLTVGSFDLLKVDTYTETWGCLRVLGDEAVMFLINEPLEGRGIRGALPDEHRRRFAGAGLTDLFGGAPLGQLRGDRVEYPLGPQGWMVMKLHPTRRRFFADLGR